MYLDESEGNFGLCNVENCICQSLKTGHFSLSVLKAVIGSQPCLQGTGFMSAGQKTPIPVNAAKASEMPLHVLMQAQGMHFVAGIQTMGFVTKVLQHCKLGSHLLMQLDVYLHCSTNSM